MASLNSVASGIAAYIGNELEFDTERRDTIRYGLEIILGTTVKVVVILLTALVLGLLPYICVLFATSISLRLLSGGAHFRTFWRCLSFSIITSVCISYAAIVLARFLDTAVLAPTVLITACLGHYIIDMYAPADNPNKPIKRATKRAIYKRLSKLYVAVWGVLAVLAAVILPYSAIASAMLLASVGGFLLQALSVIPASYRLASSIDDCLDSLRALGR